MTANGFNKGYSATRMFKVNFLYCQESMITTELFLYFSPHSLENLPPNFTAALPIWSIFFSDFKLMYDDYPQTVLKKKKCGWLVSPSLSAMIRSDHWWKGVNPKHHPFRLSRDAFLPRWVTLVSEQRLNKIGNMFKTVMIPRGWMISIRSLTWFESGV